MITPDRDQDDGSWDFDSPFACIADGNNPSDAVRSAESKAFCPWDDKDHDLGDESEDDTWGHEFGVISMLEFGQLGDISVTVGPSPEVRAEAFDDLWNYSDVFTVVMDKARPKLI
jgi:hypothetical protein